MVTISNFEKTTDMQDSSKTDPEKAAQLESSAPGSETERELEDIREPVSGEEPGNAPKVQDAGPPDGGASAWLVVLGSWCCSFCSPGWINSEWIAVFLIVLAAYLYQALWC